jgi:hypothetical protein
VAEAAAESLCNLGCSQVQLQHHGLASSKRFQRLGERCFTSDPGLRLLCWVKDQPPPEWRGVAQQFLEECAARPARSARPSGGRGFRVGPWRLPRGVSLWRLRNTLLFLWRPRRRRLRLDSDGRRPDCRPDFSNQEAQRQASQRQVSLSR